MDNGNTIDILCNTGDGVYIVDENKHIVRWNKAAESMLQYSESEVLNLECYRVLSGETDFDTPHCCPDCSVHQAAAVTPQKNFDLRTQKKNGGKIWLNVSLISVPAKGRRFLAHIIRDVSKGKMVESALNRLIEDLGIKEECPKRPASAAFPNPPRLSGPGRANGILSDREIEVLKLLAEGLPTKSLAQKLKISHFTARNHIQNILAKLDLHSKAQAVSFAYKNGIIDL